jgi:hypothetical protein
LTRGLYNDRCGRNLDELDRAAKPPLSHCGQGRQPALRGSGAIHDAETFHCPASVHDKTEENMSMDEHLPLLHYHISKTAGNSFNRAIRSVYTDEECLTNNGNITLDFLKSVSDERWEKTRFIYGHCGAQVGESLLGKTRGLLLLRDPVEQVISNYLHIAREPQVPLCKAACSLGFQRFIEVYPFHLCFQLTSINLGLAPPDFPWRGVDEVYRLVPRVLDYMSTFSLVGTVEQLGKFMSDLTLMMGWERNPEMTWVNQAPQIDGGEVDRQQLRDILSELEQKPRYAQIIATERLVYLRAKALAQTLGQRILLRSLLKGQRFDGDHAILAHRSPNGEVVLAQNFRRDESSGNSRVRWRTLERQDSHFFIRRSDKCDWLVLQLSSLHSLGETDFSFYYQKARIPAEVHAVGDGAGCIIIIDLRKLPRKTFAEVVMWTGWGNKNQTAPYYPCAVFDDFHLRAEPYRVPEPAAVAPESIDPAIEAAAAPA